MIRLAAVAALLALGCGSSRRSSEDGNGANPDAGMGSPDAGTDPPIGLDCSDLVDEGPGITAGCLTGPRTCPTAPECEVCSDTCAEPTGFGAPIVDGSYELRSMIAWLSACAAWSQKVTTGTLRVTGTTIDILWTRPSAIGSMQTRGGRYSYRIEGEELVVEQLCPEEGAGTTTRVSYASLNGILYFPSSFPDSEVFELVFEKR